MAGFLDEYGVADARRSRVIWWIVISAVVVAVTATALYFTLRTWPAKRQVSAFLDDLERHDYQAAYRVFGCAKGCPDYAFNSFLDDWGPKSPFANPTAAQVRKTRYCGSGVIVTLQSPKGEDVALWYERSAGTLGFAPWPVCAPRIPAPIAAPAP